jgi:cytochrome c553
MAADLADLAAKLRGEVVTGELAPLLSDREIQALSARLEALLSAGRFPEPGPGRPYPWPAV